MSVAFWSAEVKVGKPVTLTPPEGFVLNVQQAAVAGEGGKGPVVVRIETESIEGDKIEAVIGTLRPGQVDQFSVSLVVGYDVPTTFKITGDAKNSVFISGYFQPGPGTIYRIRK